MAAFNSYNHVESVVEATQLDANTQYEVAQALGNEAVSGLLSTLRIEYSSTDKCYNFKFRYMTDTTESTLAAGDWLVKLNEGNYIKCDNDTFIQQYLPTYQDEQVMPAHPQSPQQSFLAFVQAKFPDLNIQTDADLTTEKLAEVAEGLKSWYDDKNDRFIIHFDHSAMVDPTGLGDILAKFPAASYFTDATLFTLSFNNGSVADGGPINENNCFTYAALQSLIGELKKLKSSTVKRIYAITFLGNNDAHSAVAPSVSDDQWSSFVDAACNLTGTSRANIKR